MPTYTYKNTKTGEEWSEFRFISEMEDGVDGVEVIILPSAPTVFPSSAGYDVQKKADKWRSDFLQPKISALTGSSSRKIDV